ncbi:SIR2 family protein [Cyclobacterium sp.]|uniref:SIR2 family protein n=1 Tax=Cyclobacterium sp. TaxID=1966343 RepID=UPI0019C34F90|nr:SIR2 family protein [Cyclobacterium sp.]MBD3627531.1 SIR2 family protein [Cyclobacterium sp.]
MSILRMYTLNYDRIFKILLDDVNIDCFEGFNVTNSIDDIKGLRADVPKIINDSNCNIHYNLHGSAFWKVLPLNDKGLPHPEVVYTGVPHLPMNDVQANVQIEKGKPVFLTNIITGYQKAQKAMITPFKQMHSSFDRDCCNARKIYIVGYSFGDEHINECLKTALRYNKNLILEIIDPSFISNELDKKLNSTIFQFIDNESLYPKKIGENKFSYFKDRVIVCTLKFKDYLEIESNNT